MGLSAGGTNDEIRERIREARAGGKFQDGAFFQMVNDLMNFNDETEMMTEGMEEGMIEE